MLSGHLDTFFLKMLFKFIAHFLFLFFDFWEFFVYFAMNSDSYVCYKYLCPLCGLPFCSHNGAFWWTGAININLLQLIGLFLWLTPFVFCVRTYISITKSCSYSPVCFLWTWSFLTCRSIIYLELTCMYAVKWRITFFPLMDLKFEPAICWKYKIYIYIYIKYHPFSNAQNSHLHHILASAHGLLSSWWSVRYC